MLEKSLRDAITERRSDDRPYRMRPIPAGYLSLFRERAATLGGLVQLVSDTDREQLAAYAGSPLMVTCASGTRWPPVEIGSAEMEAPVVDHAELFVAGTPGDDALSRLRAGESISAVLLTATNIGLATCLLTEPLESRRAVIRTEVLGGTAYPHALLRVGWAPDTGAPPAVTSRCPVEDLVLPEHQ
ncbi:hypothetical protein [Nocardia rhizosphaerae]|uniref:Nitroreductase n=1 Tax=Nocardia rhizosphaerae TaxID=1691571 RepID=A0ABV8LAH3_9NOCA